MSQAQPASLTAPGSADLVLQWLLSATLPVLITEAGKENSMFPLSSLTGRRLDMGGGQTRAAPGDAHGLLLRAGGCYDTIRLCAASRHDRVGSGSSGTVSSFTPGFVRPSDSFCIEISRPRDTDVFVCDVYLGLQVSRKPRVASMPGIKGNLAGAFRLQADYLTFEQPELDDVHLSALLQRILRLRLQKSAPRAMLEFLQTYAGRHRRQVCPGGSAWQEESDSNSG